MSNRVHHAANPRENHDGQDKQDIIVVIIVVTYAANA